MNESFDRFIVKRGAPVSPWFADALQRAIERSRSLAGPHTRRKVTPWGTHTSVIAADGDGAIDVFRPSVKITGDSAEVRWTGPRALIGGVAPTINDKEITSIDETTKLTGGRDFSYCTNDWNAFVNGIADLL